jgi:hypothetical protein
MSDSDSIFPADVDDAEKTYHHIVSRGRQLRAPHQCNWYYTSAYCKGARNFVLNYKLGQVKASYTDAQGRTKFVYEELLAKYQMQKGRLLGMDLSPRVVRRNDSLSGQQDAATVQAVLNHQFPASRVDRVKRAILQPFLFYGTLGLELWEDVEDPKSAEIQIDLPWQLTPIPTTVTHPTACRGMIVRRRVPIEEVRKTYRNMKLRKNALAEATRVTVNRGDMPANPADGVEVTTGGVTDDWFDNYERIYKSNQDKGADAGKTDRMDVVWVGTVYLWDERGYMAERIIYAGDKLLARDSYWQTRTYRPITTIHDMDVGGFWSRSWMELQLPINSEQEGAIARTFENVRTYDNYGVTLVPTNFGLNNHALMTPSLGGPKYMPYEWDTMSPGGQQIQQLRPFTSGNFATQAISLGSNLSDRLSQQPPMMSGDAPGRVDSASGLGMLLESGNTPLTPTSVAIASGFSEIYRAATCRAMKTFSLGDTIAVTMLDDSLVGIVYDAAKGTIALSPSGVPHPDQVEITVRSMAPVSKQQQKLELQNQLQLQIIDPLDYRILARLENLELPVGNGIEWENYIKARVENALLFHDGKTVPEGSEEEIGVLFSRDADMHNVHLRVHRELVASIKFSMASVQVRKRILNHIAAHEQDGLGTIPQGMPNLEDAAQENLMAQSPEMQQALMQQAQMQAANQARATPAQLAGARR